MEILLLETEYSLITTNGGDAGMKYLKQHSDSIDIVLLDLMMVDMNGLEFFEQMKEDPKLTEIPVILQSGTSNQDLINKAYKAGISSFLRKPYQKKDILSAIQKSLRI
ncbi:MAG: response regulator [Rickettsiales bacterium]|nr:response regulator [Rickettsiales bacterium]